MNFDYLTETVDSDETRDELLQRLWNLQTLLDVKKRLGDLVDITDRLFGYMLYSEEGNNPFIFSTIAVIFSLPEELEKRIRETCWASEDWEAEGYPKVDYEEIYSLFIPFDLDCSQEEMEAAIAQVPAEKIGNDINVLVKEDHIVVYADMDYCPGTEMCETMIEVSIDLRTILEGGGADA